MIEIILIVAFVSLLTILISPAYDPWREVVSSTTEYLSSLMRLGYWSGFV